MPLPKCTTCPNELTSVKQRLNFLGYWIQFRFKVADKVSGELVYSSTIMLYWMNESFELRKPASLFHETTRVCLINLLCLKPEPTQMLPPRRFFSIWTFFKFLLRWTAPLQFSRLLATIKITETLANNIIALVYFLGFSLNVIPLDNFVSNFRISKQKFRQRVKQQMKYNANYNIEV